VLTGFRQHEAASAEASLKYFSAGSFAHGVFSVRRGIDVWATGSTNIDQISAALRAGPIPLLAIRCGGRFMFVGLGFKVAAAPFTSGLLTCMKERRRDCGLDVNGAEGGGICGIVAHCFRNQCAGETWLIWISAALSMTLGNVSALVQNNVKRLLAYSSIAHAGYLLVAFAAAPEMGTSAAMF